MTTRLPVIRSDECCTSPNPPREVPAGDGERMLAVFKALADATRLDVFRLIAAQDAPICACDIVDRFDVSQPTIAHHLKVLRTAGLITVSRDGVWAYYAVDPDGLEVLQSATLGFRGLHKLSAAG
jgi:ArsR family transcriptional regulator, arsenate/arsenite/antimonite-responsive transcriptional repressor